MKLASPPFAWLVVCHAAWVRFGKAAGPMRNATIAAVADRVVAFPADDSKGTWDCLARFKDAGKPYAIQVVK